MKVAYRPYYPVLLENRAFQLDQPMNINGALDRWAALRTYLGEKGVELNTHDLYENPAEVDIWLMGEFSEEMMQFVLQNGIRPQSTVFVMTEPPVVLPWGWKHVDTYAHSSGAFLTWNTHLCKRGGNFFHYHFPVGVDSSKYPHYRSNAKRNLCLMMHSNKRSEVSGELYSLRREIISHFAKRGDRLLDLFGHGWNTDRPATGVDPFYTDLYQGVSADKLETFSEYHFTFCIDNSVVPGYITYDPILSMATGTVPVYLPMPDSSQYIPENTFIPFNAFESLDELVSYLNSIVGREPYDRYVQNGWQFIQSREFYPFTMDKFCEDVHQAIQAVWKDISSAG